MEPVAWEVELDTESIPPLRQQLEWALQHQRNRLFRPNRLSIAKRQKIIAFAAPLLAAIVAYARWIAPPLPDAEFYPLVILIALAAIAAPFMPRYTRWVFRWEGKQIARRAERLIEPIEARVPATASYRLNHGQLDGGLARRQLVLRDLRLALVTPYTVLLFRRKWALKPTRMVLVPGIAAAHPFVAALTDAGIAVEHVAGAVERYGEWTLLPRATAI